MIVFDASALIAALVPADAHHVRARSLLARCGYEGGAVVHPMNLAEVLVGPSRSNRETAAAASIAGAGVETLRVDSESPVRLARLRADTSMGLPDCCALDAALQTGYPMATFDSRLARVASSMGITLAA